MKCWRSIALRNVGRRVWRTQHPLGRSSITSPVEKRTNGEYASAVSPPRNLLARSFTHIFSSASKQP